MLWFECGINICSCSLWCVSYVLIEVQCSTESVHDILAKLAFSVTALGHIKHLL